MGVHEDAVYEYRRESAGFGDELRGRESGRDPSVVQELLGPRGRGDGSSGGGEEEEA